MTNRFKLSDSFIKKYDRKVPNFGPLGEFTYKRTYARQLEDGKLETFQQTLRRVVEGTFEHQKAHCERFHLPWQARKAQKSAQEMFRRMWEFKFLPPGRGLWMMGTDYIKERGGAALNNPLGIDTKILTKEYGWIKLRYLKTSEEVTVLSSNKNYGSNSEKVIGSDLNSSPVWVKAKVSPTEYYKSCLEFTFKDKGGFKTTVVSSKNHRWYRRNNSKTPWERVPAEDLLEGDYVPIVKPTKFFKSCVTGYQHGFFFGDGTRSNGELHQFDSSIEVLEKLFPTLTEKISENHSVVRHCPLAWGKLPTREYLEDRKYIWSFLAGYVAADGSISGNKVRLPSSRLEELKIVSLLFKEIGIRCSDPYISIKEGSKNSFYLEGRPSNLYEIKIEIFDLRKDFFLKEKHKKKYDILTPRRRDWGKLVSIKKIPGVPIKCVEVPGYEQFVIDGFILTSNCGFASTEQLDKDFAAPFAWVMDMSMLGVGCGFDTKGRHLNIQLKKPREATDTHVIPDTREGWVEALRRVLDSFAGKDTLPAGFDYSKLRAEGEPIISFGGVSSGPDPLRKCLDTAIKTLQEYVELENEIDSTLIVDIMNEIGACVVSGNVRRSAEIAFSEIEDEEFLNLKNYKSNPEAASKPRWASNNSIAAELGDNYNSIAENISANGEPGIIWLENMKNYGRMDYLFPPLHPLDPLVKGSNPCGEQSLEPFELCCLVETFPSNHDSLEDYKETLKCAYLYAKTVTLIPTHDQRTNAVLLKNRRIGTSQSGIVQNFEKIGISEHIKWCNEGYSYLKDLDKLYSNWLCIPQSIKMTSVKPSGTVSLLPGVTPGIHYPHSEYYIRRIRVAKNSPLVPAMVEAGYDVEDCVNQPEFTSIVSFPVKESYFSKSKTDITLWEQLENAAIMQAYWADNQVSVTVTFKPEEAKDLATALDRYQYRLKSVSFLPLSEHGYKQAPYEEITEEQYKEMIKGLKKPKIDFHVNKEHAFCDGDVCEV